MNLSMSPKGKATTSWPHAWSMSLTCHGVTGVGTSMNAGICNSWVQGINQAIPVGGSCNKSCKLRISACSSLQSHSFTGTVGRCIVTIKLIPLSPWKAGWCVSSVHPWKLLQSAAVVRHRISLSVAYSKSSCIIVGLWRTANRCACPLWRAVSYDDMSTATKSSHSCCTTKTWPAMPCSRSVIVG